MSLQSGPPNRARSRNRTLALAGGALAALSLAYGAYTWYTSGPAGPAFRPGAGPATPAADAKGKGRFDGAGAASSGASSKLAARPSLSLSLPPSFRRTEESLQQLAELLEELSQHYLVHLILPETDAATSSNQQTPRFAVHAGAPRRGPPGLNDSGRDLALPQEPSAASIAAALCAVPNFDIRRILEYSVAPGRQAVARALACDAHVQVLLPAAAAAAAAAEEAAGGESAAKQISNLESLQKSCGLIIVVSLPGAQDPATRQVVSTFDSRPAFRVFDLADRSADEAWGEAAARLVELRAGWK